MMNESATESQPSTPEPRGAGTHGLAAAAGSVLAAMLSSACCWLPLVLLSLGASFAGLAASLERWRPLFVGAAVLLLGVAFARAYAPRAACCAGECADRVRWRKGIERGVLWASALLILAFVLFPYYGGAVTRPPRASPISDGGHAGGALTFGVGGMTCDACAAALERALEDIPGVEAARVDYRAGTAEVVATRPDAELDVMRAARDRGFTASLRNDR